MAWSLTVKRLGPGDDRVVLDLAERDPPTPERLTELLADERTFFLVAFDDEQPIGFVLAYELVRRHGDPTILFVYEVDVHEQYRRRGVATALMGELERLARERGIPRGFVLTDESNEPAMRFYESVGGVRPYDDDVMWRFEYAAG